MRALFFGRHGGNEVLQFGDRPDVPARHREVRIRVRAAALNHLDIFVRDGLPNVAVPLPQIPGADAAGEIESIGEGVEGLELGDRVLVQPGLFCGACEYCRAGEQSLCVRFQIVGEHVAGTFAEFVTLPAQNVFPMPSRLTFEQAAAFPLVYETAWRMVVGRGEARPGTTILIHGIGGGVAGAALEIALLCGARVFATSRSEEKLAWARDAGAEEAWNSGREDIVRAVAKATGKRGCDIVIDSVGEATWMSSLKAVARGGRIVTCGATSGPNPKEEMRLIFWKQIAVLGSTMANDREFRALLSAVESGRLTPRVDSVYPLEKAREAYARMEAGQQAGKIVLAVG